MFNIKLICTIGGVLVGAIAVAFGPQEAFIVLLLTAAGWLIGKYAAGEMQVVDVFLERFFPTAWAVPVTNSAFVSAMSLCVMPQCLPGRSTSVGR